MKGKKISLKGIIVFSREGEGENEKIIGAKFEVGPKTECQIYTEEGKKYYFCQI